MKATHESEIMVLGSWGSLQSVYHIILFCLFGLLAAQILPWLMAQSFCSLPLSFHGTSYEDTCPFLWGIRFRARPHPIWLHLNLNTFAKMSFPNKVTWWRSRWIEISMGPYLSTTAVKGKWQGVWLEILLHCDEAWSGMGALRDF